MSIWKEEYSTGVTIWSSSFACNYNEIRIMTVVKANTEFIN